MDDLLSRTDLITDFRIYLSFILIDIMFAGYIDLLGSRTAVLF